MITLVASYGRPPATQGRACALRAEPPEESQAEPLVPDAEPRVTATDLRQAIVRAFPLIGRQPIHNIQFEVALFYGFHPDRMLSHERIRSIAHPRQVAMYLARQLTKASLPEIGNRFGGRDHSTVIHAIKAVEKRAAEDPMFGLELEVLRERLSA